MLVKSTLAQICGMLLGAILWSTMVLASSPLYVYHGLLGGSPTAPGTFREPEHIAYDSSTRSLLVADAGNRRVQVFDNQGHFLSAFGEGYEADGIAVDPLTGNRFVSSVFGSVRIYDSAGSFLRMLNSPVGFVAPFGISISPVNRHIAIADSTGVLLFDSDENFLLRIGSFAAGPDQFSSARSVAFDSATSDLVVGDAYRIAVFDAAGNFLQEFQTQTTLPTYFLEPGAVAIDPSTQSIVASDLYGSTACSYHYSGALKFCFGKAGVGNGEFQAISGLAIDPASRNIAVSEATNNRVQIFDASGEYLSQFGNQGYFRFPRFVSFDEATGHLAVSDEYLNRVEMFDREGIFIRQFGIEGTGPGEFVGPTGIAFDPTTHNLFVGDPFNQRVQVFDSRGKYLSAFSAEPAGLSIDRTNGNLLLAAGYQVQVWSPAGSYLSAFGEPGNCGGHIGSAYNTTSDKHGIWVISTDPCVQLFGTDGSFQRQFSIAAPGDQLPPEPAGIAIDSDAGIVAVSDRINGSVKLIDASGTLLGTIGSLGVNDGQFEWPDGVAIDPRTHRLYVVDNLNARVEMFMLDSVFADGFDE